MLCADGTTKRIPSSGGSQERTPSTFPIEWLKYNFLFITDYLVMSSDPTCQEDNIVEHTQLTDFKQYNFPDK